MMIDDLKKLISFRSVTHDAAACTALLKYEQDLFVGYGMKTELGSIAGFPYLLATTGDDLRGVDVLLQAHIDVVPGTDALFTPSTDGDKLIGRGTYDMLFAVACFNKLLAGFAEKQTLAQKNIGVMLTSDEEIGGENGVAQLISGYECKVCILPDAGTHEQICTEAKGVLQLKLTIPGVAGHGARPWQTDSPFLKLPKIIETIQELFPNQDHEATTCSLTQLHGGEAHNQVPSSAELMLDIRFEPADQPVEITQRLVSALGPMGVTIGEAEAMGDSYQTDISNPYIQSYIAAYQEVTGRTLTPMRAPGSSDARFMTPLGIPVIMNRPDGGGLHGDDEWLSVSSLEEYQKAMQLYVEKIC